MTNWVARNKKSVIRAAFLVPILLVAAISISHVVSWYDLANPLSWAIYLSIAIEIAAMSAIAAASAKVKGFSVWFVFIIVTLVQFIGNIFFCYSDIDVTSKAFKDWSELTAPIFEAMGSDVTDSISQRRWLALLEGGLLPLISLTCLHFFIKYGEIDNTVEERLDPIEQPKEKVEEEKKVEEPNEITQEEAAALSEESNQESTDLKQQSQETHKETHKETPTVPKRKAQLSDKMKKIFNK